MAHPPPHLPLEGGVSFPPLQPACAKPLRRRQGGGKGGGGVKQMSVQLAWPD